MQAVSFTSKILKSGRTPLYEVHSTRENGEQVFFFILINPAKEKKFLSIMKTKENFDLKEFGKIVSSGWGEPSEDLKEFLKKQYCQSN